MKLQRLGTLACSIAVCGVLYARPIADWPYDKLTSQADLIVIATPVGVRDTGEKTAIPGIKRGSDPVPGVGVETTFEVLSVLKGDKDVKKVVFYHLREEEKPQGIVVNGPGLVSFDPKQKKHYLMFLKQEKDDRYSSLTGQTDPADAVKDLGTHP